MSQSLHQVVPPPPRLRGIAAVMIASALLTACGAPPERPETAPSADSSPRRAEAVKIRLALQPTDNAAAIQARATELERFLEAAMKADGFEADVETSIPLSTAGVVEALRVHHADAAMMSAWPATLAAERAGARIVLAEQREVVLGEEPTVGPYYFSYHVVLKDSPYRTLADLKGKVVAYPGPTSTSGYVFPVAKLVSEGLVGAPAAGRQAEPKEHFGDVVFAGGYAQAWQALRNGQADVAVTAGDINAALYAEILEGTRILSEQGPIPSHAVVYAKNFEGPGAEALTRALLALEGEHRDLMRRLVSGIFVSFEETTTARHVAGLSAALNLSGLRLPDHS